MAGNVENTNPDKVRGIEMFDELDYAEYNNVGFWAKCKKALSPRNILKYIFTRLWKPVLAFLLIFTLFLTSVYLGSFFGLFNARSALDFSGALPGFRESENFVIQKMLPVIEWTGASLGAAGDLMQSQVEKAKAERREQEEAALLAQEEEERGAQSTPRASTSPPPRASGETSPAPSGQQRPSAQDEERIRQQQEAELRRIAEERQQELNRRASRVASYYAEMNAQDAASIMENLDNEEIVAILGRMEPDAVAGILSALDPVRASSISKDILNLQPTPSSLPTNAGIL